MLGGLLFAIDRVLIARADDPHVIVVGGDVDREAIETFKAARGRDPNAEELNALRRVWLDNEVLYREGLALQVDKGDTAIRERVIFKALSVIDSNVKLPPADDNVLRAWFESHRDKYDEPARYDFEEAALSGDSSEAAVRAFVAALNSGTPGDAKAGLRVFKGRPQSNAGAELRRGAGQSAGGLEAGRVARPADARGLARHAARRDHAAEARGLRGGARPGDARLDRRQVAAEQRTAAVRALTKKYKIKHEVSAKPDLE